MDPRRRAELLASLSPEGRATYEVLRAQLARDVDRTFAESKTRLEKAVETVFGDLHTKLDRTIADLRWNRRVHGEPAKEIVAATTPTTPAANHVFPDPKHGPDLASSTSSTTRSTSPLCVSSGSITTDGSHESEVAASSTNPAPAAAAAARGVSVSSATSAAPASCGVTSLAASTSNCSTSPGRDSGAAPYTTPPVSTGSIDVPAPTMESEADLVFETPVTCSTLGIYPVANTIHVNKVPLPNLVVSPSRFAAYSTSTCMAAVSVSDDSELVLAMPTMCSTECPREDNEATRATPSPTGALLASSASIVPATCEVHSEISSVATASMASMVVVLTSPPIMWTLVCDSPNSGIAGYVVPPRCGAVLRNLSSAPILAAPASCSIDLTIVPSTASSTCLPMGHNLDTSLLVLAIAPVWDIIDTAMAEQQNNSEQKDSFAPKMDTSSLWHAIAVSEFSSSHSQRFIICESLQTAATLVSVPPFQWDEKHVWPPSFSMDVVALYLQLSLYASFELSQTQQPPDQLYGQNNKCNLLGMRGCFLFAQSSNSQDYTSVGHCTGISFTSKLTGADTRLQEAIVAMGELKPWPPWMLCLMAVAFSQNLHDSLHCNQAVSFTHGAASCSIVECCCVLISIIVNHIASLPTLTSTDGSPIYMLVRGPELVIDGFLQDCVSSCLSFSGSEKFQWTIAWSDKGLFLVVPTVDICSKDTISWNYPLSSSNIGILASTWVKELYHGSLVDHSSGMLLANITGTVHIIPSHLSLPMKIYGPSMTISVQAQYSYACSVVDNTYLQTIVECSAIEMVNYKFLPASASDWMVWKIVRVLCSVSTDEAYNSQCPVFTRVTLGSTLGQPNASLPTVIPGVLTFQALQMTWDPGEMLLRVQFAVQTPWDPGGLHWNRLEGKPKVMEGGLSASSPILSHGLDLSYYMGRITSCSWAWTEAGDHYIYREMARGATRLGSGRRLRPRLGFIFFLPFL